MKFFRLIQRGFCLAAALVFLSIVCAAEGAFEVMDEGLDMTETVSIHYPVLAGGEDEALTAQVNSMIRERCGVETYLARTVQLLSGGSLKVEWKGGILGSVLSCAVSAEGAVENARATHVWTSVNADLRDGHAVAFAELFTDGKAARQTIEVYLDEQVLPELSAHLLNSELLPLPETFFLEEAGLTLLYPVEQLSTLSDRAGDIRIGWNVLRDVLDLEEGGIPDRIGVPGMITLNKEGADKLRAEAAEGFLAGIPANLGDSMRELTDRYHLLNDPDGFEAGRLFSLEGGCFGGVYLMTDDLGRSWENSVVEGIRMDRGCLRGLCVGETAREEWTAVLGEPDGTTEIDDEKAEANRMVPGACDYYNCGEHILQLYSDENGILASMVLAE